MKELARHVEEVLSIGGALAWAVGVCGVVSLVLGITQTLRSVLCHRGRLRQNPPSPGARLSLALTYGSLVTGLLFVAGCSFLISWSRGGIVARSGDRLSTLGDRFALSRLLTLHLDMLILGSLAATVVIIVVVLALRTLPRAKEGADRGALISRSGPTPWLVLVWMPLCTALATAGYGCRAFSWSSALAASWQGAMELQLLDAAQPLEAARWALLSLAGLALVSVVIKALAGTRTAHSRGFEAMSIIVFIVGLGALLGSRSLALDARHPLRPHLPSFQIFGIDTPSSERCEPLVASVVAADGGFTTLNGMLLSGPSALIQELEMLRRIWPVLHPRSPFDGGLVVVADRDEPVSNLLPWLRAAESAGYGDIRIGVYHTRSIPTRTLGSVRRVHACAGRVELSKLLNPTEPGLRWGAHTEALMSAAK